MRKPQNWRERQGRDPEKEATRLRERFSAITRGYERRVGSRASRRGVRKWWDVIAVAVVIVIVLGWLWLSRGHGF